ncbi:MAG: hypothetical protein N2322_01675, partial [Terrimicrobiaceae bacterium]|nr:hypothetical protein [Terrimicrobiaceae bacterium]
MTGVQTKYRFFLSPPRRIRLRLGDFEVPERLRTPSFDAGKEIEVETAEIFDGMTASLPVSRLHELASSDLAPDLLVTERVRLRPASLALRYEMETLSEAIEEPPALPEAPASPEPESAGPVAADEAITNLENGGGAEGADPAPHAQQPSPAHVQESTIPPIEKAVPQRDEENCEVAASSQPAPPPTRSQRVAIPPIGSPARRLQRLSLFRRFEKRAEPAEPSAESNKAPENPSPIPPRDSAAVRVVIPGPGSQSEAAPPAPIEHIQEGTPPPPIPAPAGPFPSAQESACSGEAEALQATETGSVPPRAEAGSEVSVRGAGLEPEQPAVPPPVPAPLLEVEHVGAGEEERLPCEERLQEIFMTEENIGLERAIGLCGGLPGIRSCILARGSRVLASHNAPAHLDLVSL